MYIGIIFLIFFYYNRLKTFVNCDDFFVDLKLAVEYVAYRMATLQGANKSTYKKG